MLLFTVDALLQSTGTQTCQLVSQRKRIQAAALWQALPFPAAAHAAHTAASSTAPASAVWVELPFSRSELPAPGRQTTAACTGAVAVAAAVVPVPAGAVRCTAVGRYGEGGAFLSCGPGQPSLKRCQQPSGIKMPHATQLMIRMIFWVLLMCSSGYAM